MKRQNYHVTERQIKELARLAKKQGVPVAELVRRIFDEFIDKQKKGTK